jgi:hypothetical protein
VDEGRSESSKSFLWRQVEQDLQFFKLWDADMRRPATEHALGQEVCGQGCFSVTMASPCLFSSMLKCPATYRESHYDAAFCSHLIYLESTAIAVGSRTHFAANGIGAYFDDCLESFGLSSGPDGWIVLYVTCCGAGTHHEISRISDVPCYGP